MSLGTKPVPGLVCKVCGKRIQKGTNAYRCDRKACKAATHAECWEKHNTDKHKAKATYTEERS